MAPHRRDDQQDRRTFLRTLGLAGGALAGAAAASGAPVQIRPRRTATATPAPPGALKRATARTSLKQPLKLQKTAEGASGVAAAQPPSLPRIGRAPLPSTRQRALETIFYSGDSNLVPKDFGLRRLEDGTFSVPLERVVGYDADLLRSYTQGITLTPSGCQYAPGAEYQGTPPMKYMAFRTTYLSEDVFGEGVWLVMGATDYTYVMQVQWHTPWTASTHRTCIFELSMDNFDSDFWISLHAGPSGGSSGEYIDRIDFAPTEDNTQLALVEVPGSGKETYTHTLWFRPGNYEHGYARFNWLNIIAV